VGGEDGEDGRADEVQHEIAPRRRRQRSALSGGEGGKDEQRPEHLDDLFHEDPPWSRRRQTGYGASSRPGDRERRPHNPG
jgi:hypothetical protein